MSEVAKRLQPLPDVLRRLFLHSGNLCAFPGCANLMMNCDGVFIGQVCHIEAAEVGGERFNNLMTNEERRAESNLLLMCYEHHKITNDVEVYPVERLRRIKREHEARFSSPDRAIREKLIDWTTREVPKTPKDLSRLNASLKLDLDENQEKEMLESLGRFTRILEVAPVDVRRFLQAVMLRIRRVGSTNAVVSIGNSPAISPSDIESAFGLSQRQVKEKVDALERYGLGEIVEYESWGSSRYMIRVSSFDEWCIANDIVSFCERETIEPASFFEDLDFTHFSSAE